MYTRNVVDLLLVRVTVVVPVTFSSVFGSHFLVLLSTAGNTTFVLISVIFAPIFVIINYYYLSLFERRCGHVGRW